MALRKLPVPELVELKRKDPEKLNERVTEKQREEIEALEKAYRGLETANVQINSSNHGIEYDELDLNQLKYGFRDKALQSGTEQDYKQWRVDAATKLGVPAGITQAAEGALYDFKLTMFGSAESITDYYKNYDKIKEAQKQETASMIQASKVNSIKTIQQENKSETDKLNNEMAIQDWNANKEAFDQKYAKIEEVIKNGKPSIVASGYDYDF